MKKRFRILSALLAAALFLGLSLPMPASAVNLYFTGINDSVALLTSETMPFWSGRTLYVPYTVFDANQNGIGVSLGLYTSYNRQSNTVTLFNLRQMLVFDIDSGTCRDDMTGTIYSSRTIMRGGQPCLSLSMVCSFFGLEYTYNQLPYIPQGYLVRIKSADAVLDDARFIDAARDLINMRLRDYTQSLSSAETTTPDPPTTTTPVPPSVPSPPTPEETDGPTVYLSFRCENASGVSEILDILDASGRYAVFFLSPQVLESEKNLVRRILGSGHSVGILAGGEEDGLLERGSRALEEAACIRTTLAYVSQGQRQGLEQEGWVCWSETYFFEPSAGTRPSAFASNVLNRLSGRRLAYLTLAGNENTARVLATLLRRLDSDRCNVAIPLETML